MTYFDDLEIRDSKTREEEQLKQLNDQIAFARGHTDYFATSLKDVASLNSIDDLQKLPMIRKSDLFDLQSIKNPFAGMNALPINKMRNLFLSPGPIAEPMSNKKNEHRLARSLHAAGFTSEDRILNCFSYHHTPAGLMFESAAEMIGCPVYPGGTGQRDDQIRAINCYGLTAYVGTPDFLKLIIERADEVNVDVSSIKKALVTGGPFLPVLKEFYQERGIDVKECYATADVGLIAYQDEANGLVVEEDVIIEIVTPGTGNKVKDGQVGEVIVTLLNNKTYPLIRFATGDLSAILTKKVPAKRTNIRLKGWLGRADQTCKVRGMFVHPKQIAEIVKSVDGLVKARLIIENDGGRDHVVFKCESTDEMSGEFMVKIANEIKNFTKISADIELYEIDQLPNDGIIIEDNRR